MSKEQALRLVAQALQEVEYGEIIIKMQAGKPVWVTATSGRGWGRRPASAKEAEQT